MFPVFFPALLPNLGNKVLVALVAVSLQCATAGVLYDIDFSSPTQGLNEVVQTGSPPHMPSQVKFGAPMVVPSFGGLVNQPLRFDMAGNAGSFFYDQIQLSLPVFSESRLRVEFDFESSGLIGSAAHFVVLFDTPTVRNVYFDSRGDVRFLGRDFAGWYDKPIGTYTDDQTAHILIDIDLANNSWAVYRDSLMIGSAGFIPDERITDIRFSFGLESSLSSPNDTSAVAIDNLKVSTGSPDSVPESGSTLILFGLLAAILPFVSKKFSAASRPVILQRNA
jgi:hypothetical protein